MKIINEVLDYVAIMLMIPFFILGLAIGLIKYGFMSGMNSFNLWFER